MEAAFNTLSSADKARGDLLKTGADAAGKAHVIYEFHAQHDAVQTA